MPTTAPPFPVTGDPHLDIELRELYGRIVDVERAVGVGSGGAPSPSPSLGVVQLVEATPVKLFQGFVDFDRGWFNDLPASLPSGGPAVVLGNPRPPFVVLQVFVTIDVIFSSNIAAHSFGVGTTFAPSPLDHRRYYANTDYPIPLLDYRGGEVPLNFVQTPGGGQFFRNVGVVHTGSPTQIEAGFIQEPVRLEQWPGGMEGRVHVMVIYADTPDPETVPLNQLHNKTLLSLRRPEYP